MILKPFHRVRKLDGCGLVYISNVHATIALSRDRDTDNLGIVCAHLKVQVGEQESMTPLHLPQNRILVLEVPNVAPHGQVLNEHFEEVIVVNGLFEFFQLFGAEGDFAQESPFDVVFEAEFIRGGLTAVASNALPKPLFVPLSAYTISLDPALGGGHKRIIGALSAHRHVLLQGSLVLFLISMRMAEGEGIVAVCFSGVVEGAHLIYNNVDRIMFGMFQPRLLPAMFLLEESTLDDGGKGRQQKEGR
mmetsp:Transcript_25105/g.53429  ORF Transcript_25105/g.53429 Transcript_25105/m.53429 type:complete len:247 (-) Transcript_25105:180-920(-)